MESITLLGLVAGSLTTLSFVPQVAKIWRTRSTHDISTVMFLLFSLGVLMWLVYGIAIDSIPVIVSNAITLVLSLSVLVLKWRYR